MIFFPLLQHLEHDRAVGLQAADKLHDGLDFRVVQDRGQIRGQQPGRRHDIAGALDVGIDDPNQLHFSAGLAGNAVLVFEQKSRHARSRLSRTR